MKYPDMIENLDSLSDLYYTTRNGCYVMRDKYVEALTQALDQLRWRDVNEELPEKEVSVMVMEGGDITTGFYADGTLYLSQTKVTGFFTHNSGYDGDSAYTDAVTHWRRWPLRLEE